MNVSHWRGVLLCLVATVSWGGMFPVMTDALTRMDPYTFTSLRYGIAGAAFAIALVIAEGWRSLSLKGERGLLAWALERSASSVSGISCSSVKNLPAQAVR